MYTYKYDLLTGETIGETIEVMTEEMIGLKLTEGMMTEVETEVVLNLPAETFDTTVIMMIPPKIGGQIAEVVRMTEIWIVTEEVS